MVDAIQNDDKGIMDGNRIKDEFVRVHMHAFDAITTLLF